ncbi:hypothetical protein MRX96_031724 [Rhipicephalus microplus]
MLYSDGTYVYPRSYDASLLIAGSTICNIDFSRVASTPWDEDIQAPRQDPVMTTEGDIVWCRPCNKWAKSRGDS